MVKRRLKELGIRHVRDGFGSADRTDMYPRYADMAANGIRGTMINCRFTSLTDWELFTHSAKDPQVRPFVEALEGVNEPDLQQNRQHDGGEWQNDARGCDYWTRQQVHNDDGGPPLNVPVYMSSATGTSFTRMGNLWVPRHDDGGNMHPYPGNQKPSGADYYPFSRAMAEIRQANFEGLNVPVVATETGYHNAVNTTDGHRPVSEKAAGIYVPRLFLEYARAGVERTFTYELVDLWPDDGSKSDPQRHFGLFRHDWSYKPAATAIKNMNGWLDSPATGPRTALDYSMTNTDDPDGAGTKGDVRHLLMQKADGSYWLAVWQNSSVWNNATGGDITNSSVIARVNLPRGMSVTCYRPATAGTCGSLASSTSFSVGVPDDVLLLKLRDGRSHSAAEPAPSGRTRGLICKTGGLTQTGGCSVLSPSRSSATRASAEHAEPPRAAPRVDTSLRGSQRRDSTDDLGPAAAVDLTVRSATTWTDRSCRCWCRKGSRSSRQPPGRSQRRTSDRHYARMFEDFDPDGRPCAGA